LAAGQSLKIASCRGGWGVRTCSRSATAIHSMAVDWTPNLPNERWTLYYRRPWLIVSCNGFILKMV